MAIEGVNKKKKVAKGKVNKFGDSSFSMEASGQPPPAFLARGQGFFNKLPHYPATENNANASLTNLASDNQSLHKIYLFVDRFTTGWAVAGEYAQTHTSRSYYPRHLSQSDLVVEGQMANQYEYDKLVRYVVHHQHSILSATEYTGSDFQAVDFAMFKPPNPNAFDHFRPVKYKIAITHMEAGHERFKNAPAFTLTCKVLFDYTRGREDIVQAIDRKITYRQVFGAFTNPTPHIGETAAETAKAKKAAANLAEKKKFGLH